ncbi:hypothetical protein L208DRAFT_1423751 [Tricholoma matsutake]|nr:hypothetical protein L208DRAFT_1423751 [Tricholoma matsutake 945]
MANVLQPHIDFGPRPASHASSPFGFGFGLGTPAASAMVAGWQLPPTPGHTNPSAFQQLVTSVNQNTPSRPLKRRHEPQDDTETGRPARDHSMDRSPTPERPKRAAPKRARVTQNSEHTTKNETATKENTSQSAFSDDDIDAGVLLASLPSESLLPLLTSLLDAQPSLKSVVLSLIPRPTVDTAIQALAQSSRKLRDAYPYSTAPSSTTFSFGRPQNIAGFGQSVSNTNNSGMRDSYIISRLRPHITDFVAACFSYLPYFSSITSPTSASQDSNPSDHHIASHSTTLWFLHKGKSHPSESFLFLSAVTNHMLSQAPLTQSSLGPLLLPRLCDEWNAWINRVDDVVNREGGMFGSDTVRSWERVLDEFAERKEFEGVNVLRGVRDLWVSKVGWLIGRTVQQPMDEL